MNLEFTAQVFYWKGPAPFFFATVPESESAAIKAISASVTYGWGVIPVVVKIGETEYKTSLFPKNGKYLVPIKKDVRDAEGIEVEQQVRIMITIN